MNQASTPEEPYVIKAPPQFYHLTTFIDQEIPRPHRIWPTTRGMWDGRKSVLSMFHPDTDTAMSIVYGIVNDGTDQVHSLTKESDTDSTPPNPPSEPPSSSQFSLNVGIKQSSSLSKRNFIYTFPEDIEISEDIAHRKLFVFGGSGKHALWVEEQHLEDVIEENVRLATFDHQDDPTDGQVSRTASEVVWSHDEFDWANVSHMHLDDNTGVLTCAAGRDIWYLYFD